MKTQSNTCTGAFDLPISYRHYKRNENNTDLVIMLPGQGYSTQSPIFHYVTGLYLKNSYDVLHVNYDYRREEYANRTLEEIENAVQLDVKAVVEKFFENNSYQNYLVVGKSLGTIGMTAVISNENLKNAKFIWLTPLLHKDYVLEGMLQSRQYGLCIIGDRDPYYFEERFVRLLEKEEMKSLLIKGVNHSLEYEEDVLGSLRVLKDVLIEMRDFSER